MRTSAHTRRAAFPVGDRANRTRAAEVATDDSTVGAEQLAATGRDVTMARAVETVTSDAIFFRPFERDAVITVARRNLFVETGFKRRDKRNFRKFFLQLAHRFDVRRVVRRKNRVELFHRREKFVRYRLNAGVTVSENGFKTDSGDLVRALQAAGFRVGQLTQTLAHRDAVIRRGNVFFLFKVADRNLARTRRFADTLDATARQKPFAVHIVQTVLEAGRP